MQTDRRPPFVPAASVIPLGKHLDINPFCLSNGKPGGKLILDIGGGRVYTTHAFRFGFGCFPYPRACNKRLLGFFAPEE